MKFLNAATRRLISIATTAHIKSLGVTVKAADRRYAAAMWHTDAAQVAVNHAADAYDAAMDAEVTAARQHSATRVAALAEAAQYRRGVSF